MKSFKTFLIEGPLGIDQVSTNKGKKEVAVVMGRFQPPTLGHLKAIENAHKTSRLPVAVVMVKGSKSDVFFDTKIQKEIFEKMLTNIPHIYIEVTTGFIGDFIDQLRKKNYEPKFIFTGSDRKSTYEAQINRYKEKLNLDIMVKEIPRTDEDISATKVRNALKDNDVETFKKLMHKDTYNMFDELKKKLK